MYMHTLSHKSDVSDKKSILNVNKPFGFQNLTQNLKQKFLLFGVFSKTWQRCLSVLCCSKRPTAHLPILTLWSCQPGTYLVLGALRGPFRGNNGLFRHETVVCVCGHSRRRSSLSSSAFNAVKTSVSSWAETRHNNTPFSSTWEIYPLIITRRESDVDSL